MTAKPKNNKATSKKKAITKNEENCKSPITPAGTEIRDLLVNAFTESTQNFSEIEEALKAANENFESIGENFESLDVRTKNLWSSLNTTDEVVDSMRRAVSTSCRLSLAAIVWAFAVTIIEVIIHAR